MVDTKSLALATIRKRREVLDRIENLLVEAEPDEIALLRDALSLEPVSPNGAKPAAKRKRTGRSLALSPEVRKIAAHLRTGITVPMVREALTNKGFRLKSKRPGSSINVVFQKMITEGVMRETKAGSGRMPSEYEMVR